MLCRFIFIALHYSYFELAPDFTDGEQIYIPQHPGARSKEIAFHDTSGQGNSQNKCMVRRGRFDYSCDTDKGSSGAPIVAFPSHKVIGHHKGARGSCGNL
jgi:hypothetical protein